MGHMKDLDFFFPIENAEHREPRQQVETWPFAKQMFPDGTINLWNYTINYLKNKI